MWSFEPSFCPNRREKLEAVRSFDEIIQTLCNFADVTAADLEPGKADGLKDSHRPFVNLTVDPDVFDAFFNSPHGYRAQFLPDPDEGQAANNRLLRKLSLKLFGAVIHGCQKRELTADQIRDAFLANSAKIWPYEGDLQDFRDMTRNLAIPQWQAPYPWVDAPTGAGLWAPTGTRLRAFGAFIDTAGNEVVSRKKIRRRIHIHECGFS